MKSRNILIALGVAAALAAGVGVYSYTASAQGGPGWMMGGGGPGRRTVRGFRAGSRARPRTQVTARATICAVGAAVMVPA